MLTSFCMYIVYISHQMSCNYYRGTKSGRTFNYMTTTTNRYISSGNDIRLMYKDAAFTATAIA